MKIEIVKDYCGWTVIVDGENILECLSDEELDGLTVGMIRKLASEEDVFLYD